MHPRTHVISAYLALGGATLGGAALVSALLGDREGRIWWPLSQVGSRGMLLACGVTDLHLEGGERLRECRPAVVVANHESLFDPAVLMVASADPLRFVVKREVSRVPVFGRALSAMGHVFVDRGDGASAARSLDRAADAIARGSTVLVFPEGTRGDGGALLPFRTGAFRLAARAGVPVLPVGMAGPARILPRRGGFQHAGPVAVVVGEPFSTAGVGDDGVVELAARARAAVDSLRGRAAARLGA